MRKFIFISNSNKPDVELYESKEKITLNSVNRTCLKKANELGYEVYLGVNRKYADELECDELPIKFYNSSTYRNLFAFRDNYEAYKNLCRLLDTGEVEVIHCNTPIGGIIGRVCGKKYKIPTVIYTAHGFHFFKGASLINNTLFKFAEVVMARWTNVIITMNNEDYLFAKKMKLKEAGKVFKVHGVGIDLTEFSKVEILDSDVIRKDLGFSPADFLCIAAGDLVKRKNFEMSIKAIAGTKNSRIHYLICGDGPNKRDLENLIKELKLENRVHLLGFRKDIKSLLKVSDCFLFTSLQEGLPRSLMEAMASGLPCIVSNIRGNNDLVKEGVNGILCNIDDIQKCTDAINRVFNDDVLRNSMIEANLRDIKDYDINVVEEEFGTIYEQFLK